MKKHKEQIAKWIREWTRILLIEDWNIITIITDRTHSVEGNELGAAAWIDSESKYKRAYLYINKKNYLNTYKDYGERICKAYIVHELCHVFLNDYDDLVLATYKTESEYEQVRERTTEVLTWILIELAMKKKAKKTKMPMKKMKKKC